MGKAWDARLCGVPKVNLMAHSEKISDLLNLAQQGDHGAENELISLVYEELRIMAHRHLQREHGALTLSTTALVNEVYVKLVDAKRPPFDGTSYFFGAAARAMRQVVIDLARIRKAKKTWRRATTRDAGSR